jgi:hypothetical protein
MKIVTLIKSPQTSDRMEFRRWYLEVFAPQLLQDRPSINSLAVNAVNADEVD